MNEFIAWLNAWEQNYKEELTYCIPAGKHERLEKLAAINTARKLANEFTDGGAMWPTKK